MSEHPSSEELRSLQDGTLLPGRASAIVLHLVAGFAACREAIPPALGVVLGTRPARGEATPEEEAAYGEAIQRAAARPLQLDRLLRGQRTDAAELAKRILAEGMEVLEALGPEPLVVCEALLQTSWAIRHENPSLMVMLARFAIVKADELSIPVYGEAFVTDFRCRAWAEYGNAQRVADQHDQALYSLGRAHELYEHGSGDRGLEARLLDVEASLAAARRQYGAACIALDLVYRFHRRHGDLHLAGRALISKGLYTGYSGEPGEAARLIRSGLALVNETREPGIVTTGLHNLLFVLVEAGDYREAQKHLLRYGSRLRQEAGGEVSRLKLRGVEGRIAFGLKRYKQAEEIFRRVRAALEEENLPYKAALVGLYHAEALLALHDPAEARAVLLEAIAVFKRLHIGPEEMVAVNLLRHSLERLGSDKLAILVREVSAFLRRIEVDPAAKFNPRPI